MRWLIDGYNVIRREPDLRAEEARGLEAGRRALLRRLAAVARRSSDRFTVVFDGAPTHAPAASGGQLEIIFSRPPQTADDVLMRWARQEGGGAAVVTSDRRVADAARRAHCTVVTAEAFMAGLDAPGADVEAPADFKEEHDDRPATKRGNPRRPSKRARAAQRALGRLRRAR